MGPVDDLEHLPPPPADAPPAGSMPGWDSADDEPVLGEAAPVVDEGGDTDTGTDAGTASGPATATPTDPARPDVGDWWVVVIPVLGLLTLAAAGTFLLIQRSERRS